MTERTSHVWSPFTQMKAALPIQQVQAGRGAVLELEDGRQILDCISSWWVTLHGHGQPEIAAAVAEQANELEQVIAAGFTHRPAEELARRLVAALPAPLKWVFYSDDGSTAVEVALKLAYQFWRNQGERDRTRFLRFEGAYHGDTLGAMSVGERSLFTRPFADLLFPTDAVPFPATWGRRWGGRGQRDASTRAAGGTVDAPARPVRGHDTRAAGTGRWGYADVPPALS